MTENSMVLEGSIEVSFTDDDEPEVSPTRVELFESGFIKLTFKGPYGPEVYPREEIKSVNVLSIGPEDTEE